MKSQAVAFLLGFALTSVVLLFIPGIYKNTNRKGHASVIRTTGDSTTASNGHFNTTNTAIVSP